MKRNEEKERRTELSKEAANWWTEQLREAIRRVRRDELSSNIVSFYPISLPTERAVQKFEKLLISMMKRELKKKREIYLECHQGSVTGYLFWSANANCIDLRLFKPYCRMKVSMETGITIYDDTST